MTHSFTRRVHKWEFCAKCGLLALRNSVSNRAVLKDCPGKRDRVKVDFAYDGCKIAGNANRVWAGLRAKGWRLATL